MFNKDKILKLANKDFEKAWITTKELIRKTTVNKKYPRIKPIYGKTNPVMDTIEQLRQAYLRMGFEEYLNPVIVDEKDVYKQFGPEAMAVLDRCYYLAGLPRPDVGLSNDKIEQIKKLKLNILINDETIENLRKTLHLYKKGVLEGDDLVYEIANSLNASNEVGLKILEEVFPEFKDLKAEALPLTLRSHMTSGWFITIGELVGKKQTPYNLFSIDRCFRREQKEDKSHLRTYHSASCVLVGENVTIDDGKVVAEGLLSQFGFTDFQFRPDEKKSKYYTPDTQTEVYAYHPKLKEWLEVATFGIYSPIALSKYDIDVPVMNLGLGVERLAMINYNYDDVRKMVYPQFYEYKLSDRDIAYSIKVDKLPVLDELNQLTEELINLCIENKNKKSPCEVSIEKEIKFNKTTKKIKITLIEKEENKNLLGPSILNKIYVYNGNIYGIPETFDNVKEEYVGELKEAKEKGVSTELTYIETICYKITSKIEEALVSNNGELKIRIPIVRSLSDINLKIEDLALKQIMGDNKIIDVRGPVFLNIIIEIK